MSTPSAPADEPTVGERERSTLRPVEPRVRSLDDVTGLDEIKAELRAQARLWSSPGALERLGGRPRAGFIFCGPTGTGKTTCAHALAAESGRELYTLAGPEFAVEDGSERLSSVLSELASRRAVVFVDEADDLVRARDHQRSADDSLVKSVLVGVDRTAREIRAFFVFATNVPADDVDDALTHPGRLGRPIRFRHLDVEERTALLARLARRYAVEPDVPLGLFAAQLGGIATANLAYLFDEAAFVAWSGGRETIARDDLQEAVVRLRAGLRRVRALSPDALRRAAVHEAGHALAAVMMQRRWDAVAYVHVDPRTDGQDGVTHRREMPDEALTEDQIRELMVGALAGREAERLVMGSPDTGSNDDLAHANDLADRSARRWGLSTRGPRTADEYVDAIVEARLDDASIALLRAAEAEAARLLSAHRRALEVLATHLDDERSADPTRLRAWLAAHLPDIKDGASSDERAEVIGGSSP